MSSRINVYNAPAFAQPGGMNGASLYRHLRGLYDAARQPTGQVHNWFNTQPLSSTSTGTGVATLIGPRANGIIVPVANVVLGTPTQVVVQTPHGTQAIVREYFVQAPVGVPSDPLPTIGAIQFSLNNTLVSDLHFLSAATVYDQTGFTPISPAGASSYSANQVGIDRFAPAQNMLYELDFDKIFIFNFSTNTPFWISGLWSSGTAKLMPQSIGT